ncbi:hypothetical protein B0H14DRAFT_3424240 [Mycena olivaceomarginata]|nr:hypothetical protein B0H14DRAFT_3424240 [Mycena olivaceomarginata]
MSDLMVEPQAWDQEDLLFQGHLNQLTQTADIVTAVPTSDIEEDAFLDLDVYDDCNMPLDTVSDLFASGRSSVKANFAVGENGGLTRTVDAEKSDAEDEAASAAPLGRGQRKKHWDHRSSISRFF